VFCLQKGSKGDTVCYVCRRLVMEIQCVLLAEGPGNSLSNQGARRYHALMRADF
jgi:hypothetical protein